MIKRNKGTLILTTIIMLLPMLVGLIVWNKLPEQVPMHWNVDGEVDGWGSKALAVFGFPLFILAIHWVCVLVTSIDPKGWNVNSKMMKLVLWTCPFISLLCCSAVYAVALGYDFSVEIIMPLVCGVLFVVMGNLLPKCKRNYTIGIKLPWTLDNDENWNRTHRLAGWLWVAGGAVIMATSFLGSFVVFFGVIIVMVLAPTIYSYLLYRKKKKTAA